MRAQSTIKKYLDVGKNSILSNRAGVKTIEVNQLTFEATEELFSNSVVIGIILTRHDLPEGSCDKR